jgi:hypothetical protein
MPSPARFPILALAAALRAPALLALAAGAPFAAPMVASADIKAVAPNFVAITKDNIPMKAADGNIYYPVRILKTGDVLRIDGEGSGWLRAEYLPGTKAYVRADEASFDEATKTLKLTRASKLMAANATSPRPWWPLLDTDLPAGTAFQNAEPVRGADNAVEGYLVPAPIGARGYVRVEATRPATEDEIRAYRSPDGSAPGAAAAEPTPAVPAPPPAAPPAQPEAAAPTPVPPPSETITMTNQPAPGATAPAPASSPETAPAPIQPAPAVPAPVSAPVPAPTTVVAPPVPVTPPALPPVTSRVDDLNTLRSMFDRVITAGNESEIATVIAEFNRTIASLGDNPADNIIRRALEQRREALVIRQQLFDLRREVQNNDTLIVERTRQVKVAIEEAQKQAIYTIVGRMLPSTVYNGQRGLPLMYRIESADLSSTRTLGYVVPREGVDLLTRMGKTVGIVGEAKFDPALGVNIVAPRRVDVLEIVGGRLQVVTDTQTTTTTTTVGGQATSTSTTTTTTTTSGGLTPPAPDAPPADPNK